MIGGSRITHGDWGTIEARIGTVTPVTGGSGSTLMPDPGEIEADAVLQAFRLLGCVQGHGRATTMGWGFDVECPWLEDHTDRIASGAVYVPVFQRFQCHHGHCQDHTIGDVRVKLNEQLRTALGTTLAALEFDDVDPALVSGVAAQTAAETAQTAQRVLASYENSEDGLALAFAAEHAGQMRFDHTRQCWLIWAKAAGFWRQDGTAQAFHWARQLARAFRKMQDAAVKALGKIAVAGAIERAARTDPRLATDGLGWDPDPWRAGAPGCEIELRTGGLQPPDPVHMITKQLGVAPRRMATPVWDQFLWDSTGGDLALIVFLQAWFGYCLTGDTAEEKFVFLFGPGGNGKSTFVGVMTDILRDYAVVTSVDTFMVRKHVAHPTEIARLAGVRAVIANEIEESATFNAVRLKELTGGGEIAARFISRNFFQFKPQFKLTMLGNHQPRIVNVDEAMRRRLILVPFTQKPARLDTSLKERLVPEYPGILSWAIEGENLRRAMGGLTTLIPGAATAATTTYLDEQDTFKAWAAERCEFGTSRDHIMSPRAGFEDYRTWCADNQCTPTVGEREFSQKVLTSFPKCQLERSHGVRKLVGLRLSPQNVVNC